MVVRAGREFLAIPGPTTVPDEVLAAMHRPAIDIYSGELLANYRQPSCRPGEAVSHQGTNPTSTSPTAMAPGRQRSPTCCRGATRVLGAGKRPLRRSWGEHAAKLGVEIEMPQGRLAARRAAGRRGGTPAPGPRRHPQGGARGTGRHRLRRRQRHRGDRQIDPRPRVTTALFMVDAVASLGCVPFEMDAWGVDVTMSARRKA